MQFSISERTKETLPTPVPRPTIADIVVSANTWNWVNFESNSEIGRRRPTSIKLSTYRCYHNNRTAYQKINFVSLSVNADSCMCAVIRSTVTSRHRKIVTSASEEELCSRIYTMVSALFIINIITLLARSINSID